MLEHDLTWTQMQERVHVDEMLKRVAHMEWQDEQRTAWMCGDTPEYTELYDLMEQAKRFEVVEDDDFKMTIDYQNMTSTFEVK